MSVPAQSRPGSPGRAAAADGTHTTTPHADESTLPQLHDEEADEGFELTEHHRKETPATSVVQDEEMLLVRTMKRHLDDGTTPPGWFLDYHKRRSSTANLKIEKQLTAIEGKITELIDRLARNEAMEASTFSAPASGSTSAPAPRKHRVKRRRGGTRPRWS